MQGIRKGAYLDSYRGCRGAQGEAQGRRVEGQQGGHRGAVGGRTEGANVWQRRSNARHKPGFCPSVLSLPYPPCTPRYSSSLEAGIESVTQELKEVRGQASVEMVLAEDTAQVGDFHSILSEFKDICVTC